MDKKNQLSPEADSSPFSRLLRIFEERKEQLRFPDVDAEKLKGFQVAVQKEQESVRALEEKLAAARQSLVSAEQELQSKLAKAHAYLQIFAAGNAELEAELAEIKLNSGERSGRKPRPAPQKTATTKTAPSSKKQKDEHEGEQEDEAAAE